MSHLSVTVANPLSTTLSTLISYQKPVKCGNARACLPHHFAVFFWFYDMFNDVMNLYIQNGLKKGY